MLSCSCDDYFDTWYYPPNDFSKFDRKRRKRCVSCKELINIGSDCIEFEMFCSPRSDIEELIWGDQVQMASKYMCEKCGEIFLNLSDVGYCITIGNNIQEDLEAYWDITGFEPKATGETLTEAILKGSLQATDRASGEK